MEPAAELAEPRRPRWSIWLIAGLALAVAALYGGAEALLLDGRLGLPLDDSWIHLQFARNLAAGDGLSFNPGELVTGTTAPLWTALLSVFFLLPGSPLLWAKLLGVALFVLAAELVYRIARELGLTVGLSVLAATLTVFTDWLAWSALSGLEIPLFVALSLAGILLHMRERRRGTGPPVSMAVLALACLARPEGLLLLVLALVDRLLLFGRDAEGGLTCRRPQVGQLLRGLAPAALLLAPMLAFNLAVGGSPAPTTLGAKVPPAGASGPSEVLPSLGYLHRAPIDILFTSQPFMLLLAGAGLLALASRLGGARDRGLLLGSWLVGLPLAYGVLSAMSGVTVAGNFGRYFFPLFPILIVLGVAGLESLAGLLAGGLRCGRLRVPIRVALLALLLWPSASDTLMGWKRYVQSVANVEDGNVQVAAWLGARVPPEAVIAVNDIGVFGYMLPNRIVDLAGIVHPEARRLRFQAAAEGRLADEGTLRFLSEERPDLLVIFPNWFPALVAEGSPFSPIQTFSVHNNITLGGDRIVIYSTPWTRAGVEPAGAAPQASQPQP